MTTATPSRINLGPLTTVFTQPAACTVGMFPSGATRGWLAQSCSNNADFSGLADDTSCWPPRTTNAPTPTQPLQGWGVYSPGLSCPAGYVTRCSATAGNTREFSFQFAITGSETAVGCCPQGFDCSTWLRSDSATGSGATTIFQTCTRVVPTGSFAAGTCDVVSHAITSEQVVPTVESGTASTTTVTAFSLNAPMIQIIWRPEDLDGTAIATSFTNNGTGITTETATPSSSSSSSSSSGGTLSNGAAAGIGVGVAAICIAVSMSIFWYCLRRRKRRGHLRELAGINPHNGPKLEHELSGNHEREAHELGIQEPPQMLDSGNVKNSDDRGRQVSHAGPWFELE